MAKQNAGGNPVRLRIRISSRSEESGTAQVARQLRALIESDSLKAGDVLPSEGRLAEQLGVGRKIVRAAYGKLVDEGVLIKDHPHNKRVAGKRATPAKRAAPLAAKGTKKVSRGGGTSAATRKTGRK